MTDGTPVDAYIAVGANIEPERHIPLAMDRLAEKAEVLATSTFYRTASIGRPEQPAYLNGVWHIQTTVSARTLKFGILRDIETELGRTRGPDKYSVRPIDLDLVVYGEVVLDEPDLRIPDPDIRTRPFVAVPLLELAPDVVLPDSGEPLASLPIAQLSDGMEAAEELTRTLNERLLRWT